MREEGNQHTVSGFVETMLGVAMAGEDHDFMATVLQSDGSVDDQSFGPANPKVGMKECDILGLFVVCLSHDWEPQGSTGRLATDIKYLSICFT